MIPTSLPAKPPIASGPAQTNATPAARDAPTDFLLMLGQLIGPAAPTPASAASGAAPELRQLMRDADDSSEDREASDLLALLPFSLPMMAQDTSPAKAGMAVELQLARGAGRAAIVVDSQALKDLSAALSATHSDGQMSFDSALSPHASTEAPQPMRAAPNPESMLSRPVHAPVGSAAWADEIGSRLTMMTEQGRQTASLRLSPEHLGPLEIRIAIRDDQASVWFGAAHADTRAAIEHALPRLRELFESQGMSLSDAGVFREPPREQATPAAHTVSGSHDSNQDETTAPAKVNLKLGLLDAYA